MQFQRMGGRALSAQYDGPPLRGSPAKESGRRGQSLYLGTVSLLTVLLKEIQGVTKEGCAAANWDGYGEQGLKESRDGLLQEGGLKLFRAFC